VGGGLEHINKSYIGDINIKLPSIIDQQLIITKLEILNNMLNLCVRYVFNYYS